MIDKETVVNIIDEETVIDMIEEMEIDVIEEMEIDVIEIEMLTDTMINIEGNTEREI